MCVSVKTMKLRKMYTLNLHPQYLHYIHILNIKTFSIIIWLILSNIKAIFYIHFKIFDFERFQYTSIVIHLCKRQTEPAELTYRLETNCWYGRTGSYILYRHVHNWDTGMGYYLIRNCITKRIICHHPSTATFLTNFQNENGLSISIVSLWCVSVLMNQTDTYTLLELV